MRNNIIPEAETISIILPTRKRPKGLTRLVDSIINTSKHIENIEICICVDHDDMDSIIALHSQSKHINIKSCSIIRQRKHGHYWNSAWKLATGDVLQMSSDDFIYRTQNWDVEILKEINKFEDKMVFVYGEDGVQHGKLGTHFFIHRRWADALDEFVQMHTNVFYHDTWTDVLATKLNRRKYRKDLYFEHMHPCVKKVTRDQVSIEAKRKSVNDEAKWEANWQGEAMERDFEKLKVLLHE